MIFELPGIWTIIIDFIVWLVIHVVVSISISRLQVDSFNPGLWLYMERDWERNGVFYQAFFRIKTWKKVLPDGAAAFKGGFRKKHLANPDVKYIRRFILETCRAELTHWIIFISSVVFFIWNDWWIGIIMIAYGFLVNFPCIVTQRYNRIRLKRIYDSYSLS
jgi:glycosyl-4,4'-diaponeurosporenoate acyltransferase